MDGLTKRQAGERATKNRPEAASTTAEREALAWDRLQTLVHDG